MSIIVREVDKGWNRMRATMRLLKDGSFVKVGVLNADAGAEAPEPGSPLTTASLAALMELGSEDGHIPARPFIGTTFDKKREEVYDLLRKLLGGVYDGKLTVEQVLGMIGAKFAADIKNAVTQGDGIPPPNADSTIERKGSSRPLVDTGRMIAALTWAVILKGKD